MNTTTTGDGAGLRRVTGWLLVIGAVTFAVYDLTNHATLRDWSATMTVVDICWGAFSCSVTSWAVATLTRTS